MATVALLALSLPLAACSDDEGDDTSSETTEAASDTTVTAEASADDATTTSAATDDSTPETTTEAASGDIETTDLLDFLLAEDPEIGALFDWNTGDGIIGVTYLGTQEVGLYAVEVDETAALATCELASDFVFALDSEATITVYTGGYSDGVPVATREGEAGTCAPA